MDKEFLMDRLNDMIGYMFNASETCVRMHWQSKAEGYLDALYMADIVSQKEYIEYGKKIDDLYWKRM